MMMASLADEIHVWTANLDELPVMNERWLDEREQRKASSFRIPLLKERYIKSHHLTRQILSLYLDEGLAHIDIAYEAEGKPYLSGLPLHYNISHSHDAFIMAIHKDSPIGVDIQYMDATIEMDVIAKHYYASEEQHSLQQLHGDAKLYAFYHYWTGKEAFVKAHGAGGRIPLRHVIQRAHRIGWEQEPDRQADIITWLAQSHMMASLVVYGKIKPLKMMRCPDDLLLRKELQ